MFTISKATFEPAISRATAVAGKGLKDKRTVCSIKTAKDGVLVIQTVGPDASLTEFLPGATVTKGFDVLVEPSGLRDFLRAAKASDVKLSIGDSFRVDIAIGGVKFRLAGEDPAGMFPPLTCPNSETFTVNAKDFLRAVAEVAPCISKDEARYGLNGAHIHAHGEQSARIVGTDGNRLGCSEIKYKGAPAFPRKALIPHVVVQELAKLPESEEWTVTLTDRSGKVEGGSFEYVFKMVEGDFPDYRQVIPKNHKGKVTIPTKTLSGALSAVGSVDVDAGCTVFNFRDGELCLTRSSSINPKERAEATVQYEQDDGGDMKTGCNSNFWLDFINCFPSADKMSAAFGQTLDPIIIRPAGREDAFHLVMPMRLD